MKKITPLVFLVSMLVIASCKKDVTPSGNQVTGTALLTTADAALVTSTSAQLGGTVTDIGSCPVSMRGVAIATTHSPAISGTFYPEDPSTEGQAFTIPVGSLTPGTTYYVRAFAINCKGTSYGNEIQFTTGGGTGGNDTAYFKLTIGGVTYFSYDLLNPVLAGKVFPEGDTRYAVATWDSSNQVFTVASSTFFPKPFASTSNIGRSLLFRNTRKGSRAPISPRVPAPRKSFPRVIRAPDIRAG